MVLFHDALYGVSSALGTLIPVLEPVGGGPDAGGVPVAEFSMIVLASALLIACPCMLGLATPAASAESGSEHPLARAIVEGARERLIDPHERYRPLGWFRELFFKYQKA